MKHLLPLIIAFAVYELLETFWLKTISQVSVTRSLNNRKLSALQNVSDPSPEYLVCKIQTKHPAPYLYRQGPECFPCPCRAFSACIQGPCWSACKPGRLRTWGPSPSFGSCFHSEAPAPPSWPHRSHVCACSRVPLTLSLTHRPIPHLHLRSGSSLWTCWELPRLWLTPVTISGPDPLPQLMAPVPDSPWETAQPCLLALPLSSQLACPRRAACPRCPLTHGLPTDQVSSSGELLRTLA